MKKKNILLYNQKEGKSPDEEGVKDLILEKLGPEEIPKAIEDGLRRAANIS